MRPPLLLLTFAALAAEAAPKLDFNRDIRPILSANAQKMRWMKLPAPCATERLSWPVSAALAVVRYKAKPLQQAVRLLLR